MLAPLGEGVLKDNLGIPVLVVVAKVTQVFNVLDVVVTEGRSRMK